MNVLIINCADSIQATRAFSDLSYCEKLMIAQALLQKIRTGESIQDILGEVDPEATLSQVAEEMLMLHADEPADSIIGIVLAIILASDREGAE